MGVRVRGGIGWGLRLGLGWGLGLGLGGFFVGVGVKVRVGAKVDKGMKRFGGGLGIGRGPHKIK